jgi:hypothetical protein
MQKRFLRLLKEFLEFSSLHFGMLELWGNFCCWQIDWKFIQNNAENSADVRRRCQTG